MYDRKECGDGIGENFMVRMIVLWREFQKDAKDLGMLKPFFLDKGGWGLSGARPNVNIPES